MAHDISRPGSQELWQLEDELHELKAPGARGPKDNMAWYMVDYDLVHHVILCYGMVCCSRVF